MLEGGVPSPMADFLVAFYGLMREGSTDFVTDTVPEVTGGTGRTLGAFAREHASSFDASGPSR